VKRKRRVKLFAR